MQHAGDDLQAVVDAVIDLFGEDLVAFQRRRQIALGALPVNGHAENVGGALQEGKIVGGELALEAAVDFKDAVRLAVALQDHVHGAMNAMSRSNSGVRKRSSFSR